MNTEKKPTVSEPKIAPVIPKMLVTVLMTIEKAMVIAR